MERGVAAAPRASSRCSQCSSLVAGACSRGDDDVATGGDASSTTAPPDGTNGGDGEAGPGDFGDLKDVCGPAEGDNADDTAQGVTERRDPDRHDLRSRVRRPPGPEPGAVRRQPTCSRSGATRPAASTAARSSVTERDAKLTEYKQRITEACARGLLPRRRRRGVRRHRPGGAPQLPAARRPRLPGVPAGPGRRPRGAAAARAPLDELPIGVYQYLDKKFPDSTSKVGFMTGNVPATVTVDEQNQEAREDARLGRRLPDAVQRGRRGQLDAVRPGDAEQRASRASSTPASRRTGQPAQGPRRHRLRARLGRRRRQPPRRQAHRGRRAGGQERRTCSRPSCRRSWPTRTRPPSSTSTCSRSTCPTASPRRCSATTRSRPGSSSPPPPRSAAPTSPASACTTTPSRSRSGPVAACTPPAIPSASQGPGCGMVVEASPDGFAVPDDFEPTDGLFRCDDDNVVKLDGRLRHGHHAGERRQEPRRPRMT